MIPENLKNNRYFGVIFLIPIIAGFLLGGIFLEITVSLMAFRALYEFFAVVENMGINPGKTIAFSGAVILFALFLTGNSSLKIIAVTIIFLTTAALIQAVFMREHTVTDAAMTVMGFIYCCAYFAFIILISHMPEGYWYVLSIFTIAWGCDTAAYYGGRFLGKRKLIPEVSPKKTVEGAVTGLFGGAVFTMLLGLLSSRVFGAHVMSPLNFLFMGFLGSFFSQVGDLIASMIKRDAGVKDYPKLIPGHGGILDRFDSIILAAVAVFLYLTIVQGF